MNTDNYYLVGKDCKGNTVWLEKPAWECGWYWGFGRLETMKGNREPSLASDIASSTSWRSSQSRSRLTVFDWFVYNFGLPTTDYAGRPVRKEKGKRYCRFTNDQLWRLCELMESAYLLADAATVLAQGSARVAPNPCYSLILNPDEAHRINTVVLPEIFRKVAGVFDEADGRKEPSVPFVGSIPR